ncbi:MAG TPA: protein translocase subunit SecD [Candidatus Bathyarchaeia archaeon]|nr:protein translocase subunit SecD [Candidatus Bathyarchaeia archaeon]
MKNNLYRTLLIVLVLIFTGIYIYPTAGWMLLSDQARQERVAKWKAEDSVYHPPNFWRDVSQGVRRWAEFDVNQVVTLGLDLQGGVHMVLGFELTDEQKEKGFNEAAIQELLLQKIRRRIAEFEAKDPIIQALGANQIQIQLPGEKDIDRATRLIKQTALLTFHIASGTEETTRVINTIRSDKRFENRFTPFLMKPRVPGIFRIPVDKIVQVRGVVEEINASQGLLPEAKKFFISQPPNPWDDQEYELYLLDAEPQMTGEGLTGAMFAENNDRPGYYMIHFQFGADAASRFGEVTGNNIGRALAIVLDGVVVSAPTIESRITRQGQITGNFSFEQAKDLTIALNSGSMPVPVREEYMGVVGASLGTDSIRKGLYSSVFALASVMILMLVYYRFGGLVANVALLLNGLIMLAAFAYFRLTLTLPGIAGFVLTLGMAVDANVLIFERVREEVRNGKSLISAIELGYKRATVTILDANITTLIAALVLLQFGTGPVQGFGVALAIGIFTSVFTALVVTKAIFDFMVSHKRLSKLTMMSLIKPDTKIPFIEWRNKAFIVSGILILAGIAIFFGRGYEKNFGVDFASGSSMVVRLDTEQPVKIGDVRRQLTSGGFPDAIVQEFGEGATLAKNQFTIRTTQMLDTEEQAVEPAFGNPPAEGSVRSRLKAALRPLTGELTGREKVVIERAEVVGPAIGSQLRNDAIKAVLYSFLFMIAYMWFRYNLVFGVTAVIALAHDTLICTGLLALYGGHIDMTVVAAVLTIVGYSVNDTVVIFDRIREDMRVYSGRGWSYMQIMNQAINQTLGRTILTSGLTFTAVLMLFLFGGQVLHDFAFYLMVGILIGTYSSTFVASALAYMWQTWWKKRQTATNTSKAKSGPSRRTGGKEKEAAV